MSRRFAGLCCAGMLVTLFRITLFSVAAATARDPDPAEQIDVAVIAAEDAAKTNDKEPANEPAIDNADKAKESPAKEAPKEPTKDKEPAKEPAKETPKETAKATPAKKPEPKTIKVAGFRLHGEIGEGVEQESLFGESSVTVHSLTARLDKAALDKDVAGVQLELDGAGIGRGRLEELRGAIQRVRRAGKPVHAFLKSGSKADYLLAACCDKIVLLPECTLTLTGVRMELQFYKDIFDRYGIQADMLQIGDYKGTGEPYTRNSMSPELREKMEILCEDFFQQMIEQISTDRKLERSKVKDLLDEGLHTGREALAAGLVDQLGYEDELKANWLKIDNYEELKLLADYGAPKREELDLSGMAGMFKMIEIMSGGEKKKAVGKGKKIAIVYAVGAIVDGKSGASLLSGETVGSETLSKALKQADNNPDVVAIVLRIDSPGGSALASDVVWRVVTQCKKPVVASMGDTAASGGYYIAMGADKIIAEPGTLTGSIGVVGGKISLGGALEKFGVKTEVISRGKNSGFESQFTPLTESERKTYLKMMRDIYEQFTSKAASGRKMEKPQLENLAGGRVFTGRQAVVNKLVDQLGTLEDAVAEARKLANIGPEEKIDRISLPEGGNPFGNLSQLLGLQTESSALPRELVEQLRTWNQLPALRQTLSKPALMVPYEIKIR